MRKTKIVAFFNLQSVTYKKAKYVLTCKIKNSRKGETVDVEKFAKGFSVKLGEAEWNAVCLRGEKPSNIMKQQRQKC